MFDNEIDDIRTALMNIQNSQWDPEPDDPRNLDPEDEPLASMIWSAGDLEAAVENLIEAIHAESRRRQNALDEMEEEEYERWEADVHARND